MCKDRFTRETQKENNLKQVIIRIDYDGMTSSANLVDALKIELRKYFTTMTRSMFNQAKLNLSNAAEIARTLSIPIDELKNTPVFDFATTPFGATKDSVKLEISSFYSALTIISTEYGGINPYFDFMSWYMAQLYNQEPFLDIKRLGIRKRSGESFNSIEEISHTYEQKYYFGQTVDGGNTLIRREYQDCFWNDEENIKVNYNRAIRTIKMEDKNGFQIVLDIDVYVDEGIIQKEGFNFKNDFCAVFSKLNNYQYELYKKAVTVEYLEKTSK